MWRESYSWSWSTVRAVSWTGRGLMTVTSTGTGAASQEQSSLSKEMKTGLAERHYNFRTKIIINGQSVEGSQVTVESYSTLFLGMEAGPVPDTTAFIQKLEEEKRRQEKGEVPDNRSFLAKYWMYIVPLVIFMAINGAAAPEGQS